MVVFSAAHGAYITMDEILQQIGAFGLVPMIKIDQAKDAVPLAKALSDGGLPVAEISQVTINCVLPPKIETPTA